MINPGCWDDRKLPLDQIMSLLLESNQTVGWYEQILCEVYGKTYMLYRERSANNIRYVDCDICSANIIAHIPFSDLMMGNIETKALHDHLREHVQYLKESLELSK